MSELEALRDQAARIAAVKAYPGRGPLMRTARRITDEAYQLGREHMLAELAVMPRGERNEILSRARHPSRLALSDDDSEAQADAAEQRAQFT